MQEIARTNDPVLISWLVALLKDGGIEAFVLDAHTSTLEGTASAIPRRVMVIDEDHARAKSLVEEAGGAGELRD